MNDEKETRESIMETKEVELSEAMTLLTHVWKCALRVNPFSDRRFSSTMYDAMELAIKGGLNFGIEDCTKIGETFTSGRGYYKECILSFDDGFYTKAVIVQNISACHTFEHCVGRKPFIVDNVDHPYYHVAGKFGGRRTHDRLAIGSEFTWQGKRVKVTNFDDKNERIFCCTYKPQERNDRGYQIGTKKVEHIYKLTHKDLRQEVKP